MIVNNIGHSSVEYAVVLTDRSVSIPASYQPHNQSSIESTGGYRGIAFAQRDKCNLPADGDPCDTNRFQNW